MYMFEISPCNEFNINLYIKVATCWKCVFLFVGVRLVDTSVIVCCDITPYLAKLVMFTQDRKIIAYKPTVIQKYPSSHYKNTNSSKSRITNKLVAIKKVFRRDVMHLGQPKWPTQQIGWALHMTSNHLNGPGSGSTTRTLTSNLSKSAECINHSCLVSIQIFLGPLWSHVHCFNAWLNTLEICTV